MTRPFQFRVPTYAASGPYSQVVLSVAPSDLILYYPLQESAGPTADNAEGTAARDGTYNGSWLYQNTPGPFAGDSSPRGDNSTTYVDFYSASLDGVYDGNEITVNIWGRLSASNWSNGETDELARLQSVTATNLVQINKTAGVNELHWRYTSSSVTKEIFSTAQGADLDWFMMTLVASDSGNYMRAYYNGSQVSTDQTGLGTWAGALNSSNCNFGSSTSPGNVWPGWLAHAAIWKTALTAGQITTLYNGGPTS